MVQLQNTRLAIGRFFGSVLDGMRGFKLVETLKITFVQRINDKNEYRPIYFNSKPKLILDSGDFMSNLTADFEWYWCLNICGQRLDY